VFWLIVSGLGLLGGGYWLYSEGRRSSTRTPPSTVRVGADIPEAVTRLVSQLVDRLTRNDAGPVDFRYEDTGPTVKKVTFLYYTAFRAKRADELLTPSYRAASLIVRVVNEVISSTSVGAEAPAHVLQKIRELTALLTAHDASPARYKYDAKTLFVLFWTPFRLRRAMEVLPPSYAAGQDTIFIQAALVDQVSAQVGQVVGTAQETPWTCGPAVLRAVLAHYGRPLSEPEVAQAVVVAPAIGSTPEGMVRAAELYGCSARAVTMDGVKDLVELLERGVPPIVIIDSFTRPGKVGHYVVVSEIHPRRGLVTLMDPHVEGNWRALTIAEFERRWWAKRRNAKGEMATIPRVAVVVEPGEGMVAVGADESPVAPPTHGRTAFLKESGKYQWLSVLTKVTQTVTKAVINWFTGGKGGKAIDVLQDELKSKTDKLNGKEFVTWINNASNEEVALLGAADLRHGIKQAREKKIQQATRVFDKLGLTEANLTSDPVKIVTSTFGTWLIAYNTSLWKLLIEPFVVNKGLLNFSVPLQLELHHLQATAILLYGPKVVPVLMAQLAKKPTAVKDPSKDPGLSTLLAWADSTIAALDKYQEARP